MKAHLIDTHLKVICKGHGQISGSCFSKDGCFGGISVSQIHLVYIGKEDHVPNIAKFNQFSAKFPTYFLNPRIDSDTLIE